MEKLLLYAHISCGCIVLLLGLIQLLDRKGGKRHIAIGKVYVGAMWIICLSALLIISFYRFNTFLLVIAVLTFYASFSGVRVLSRKEVGSEQWYDWMVAIVTAAFGLGLLFYAVKIYFLYTAIPLAILCLIFGFLTFFNALQDVRFFISKKVNNQLWWLKQHISAMGGSYIAAVTAFAVQNPELFLLEESFQWLLWVIPTLIGSPIIARISRKWTKVEAT